MSQNDPLPLDLFWALYGKGQKKYDRARELPLFPRNRFNSYLQDVLDVYTRLWAFQKDNRQRLVEAGLKRWNIGQAAFRIAELFFDLYLRTGDQRHLAESFSFYEAILTREYFKEGSLLSEYLATERLRCIERFLVVCLVANQRDTVPWVANLLRETIDESKMNFQDSDFSPWTLLFQCLQDFLKVDSVLMNIRPLRLSPVLDQHPDSFHFATCTSRRLQLKEAILCSYRLHEVKFLELTLSTFRMLQCLEWEPSGSFYQTDSCISGMENSKYADLGIGHLTRFPLFIDTSLPRNPQKTILDHPPALHFIAVLASICENFPLDGVVLIYISASGIGGPCPRDFIPFTRRPLFLIIDSDNSQAYKAIHGAEKGVQVAMLLSPCRASPIVARCDEVPNPNESLFTMFLTSPLQAFCILIGRSGAHTQKEMYRKADEAFCALLTNWGTVLATSTLLDEVWAQVLRDPFLWRLLLRFIFCRTVLTLFAPTFSKSDFVPDCMPPLPESLLPSSATCQSAIHALACIFGATEHFVFDEPSSDASPERE